MISILAENITLDFHLGKPGLLDFMEKSSNRKPKSLYRALDSISFQIESGDRVGLIGRNGAGKSTLLKLIAGILVQTKGKLKIQGVQKSLLDLTADLIPQATCAQNIRLHGLLNGLTGVDLKNYSELVVERSDIDPFLYSPVTTLSTGMKTRFLLALIGDVEPEILVMDEWIGASDNKFIEQDNSQLNKLVIASKIFVLASHNRSIISKYCNRVILMDGGTILFDGDVAEGFKRFNDII